MAKKPQTSKDAADKVVKNIRRKTRQSYTTEEKNSDGRWPPSQTNTISQGSGSAMATRHPIRSGPNKRLLKPEP